MVSIFVLYCFADEIFILLFYFKYCIADDDFRVAVRYVLSLLILRLLYCTIRSVAVDITVAVLYVAFCCC